MLQNLLHIPLPFLASMLQLTGCASGLRIVDGTISFSENRAKMTRAYI